MRLFFVAGILFMGSWEIEKLKYIRILEVIINGISNILRMDSYSIMADTLREKLVEWKTDSEKLFHKLKNNEFEIAIVGLEKAGKSSFSNAFIENSLLPTDQGRCTYTSTCIAYNEADIAEISFYTKEEFARNTFQAGLLRHDDRPLQPKSERCGQIGVEISKLDKKL